MVLPCSEDAARLRSLLAAGDLLHPFLSSHYFVDRTVTCRAEGAMKEAIMNTIEPSHVQDNFVDLAASLAICCGVDSLPNDNDSYSSDSSISICPMPSNWNESVVKSEIHRRRLQLASEIGGQKTLDSSGKDWYPRRHIVFILCDGMGNSVIENSVDHMSTNDTDQDSFFAKHNQPCRLRAVFPSTTPAALTTLATATWPGRHGMPGWNLRDKKGCDLPGQNCVAGPVVQLRVLAEHIIDDSSGKLASETGFQSWDDVFVEVPWARKIYVDKNACRPEIQEKNKIKRKMIYINAYNGDDYQNWSQGDNGTERSDKSEGNNGRKRSASDFSEWQIGNENFQSETQRHQQHHSTLFETAKIEETAYDTLGTPKGSADAIKFFRDGVDSALSSIANAEKNGDFTFTYLYTAHPDKHMHSLGVEHDEVKNVVQGIESEIERFWRILGDRELLLMGKYDSNSVDLYIPSTEESKRIDASIIVTADHGHITIPPEDMMTLPDDILACLEYANVGVWGTGRHAYLHCRAGLQSMLQRRWQTNSELREHFLLLTVNEAIECGLFGPDCMRWQVRPRLGDFIAISTGRKTLAKPFEVDRCQHYCKCQGAHGSLLPEEMSIPFILLAPPN
mmetsp:Transcript_25519/g.53570  ORF Transcript_25519/g.53570 Transcript_25519/m.53570 type:complete len:620 (+) Transcript_25519:87-1946(+)|eukprot:CAMPEP_0171446844 /NCGR_PEP_ID=MMETSP0881-20121228/38802_1 /TAXON_ID=67004 /ORGANISM="Thalassiosira weissflogii, Strain CCMP1336" /LENGTH=619 /DNA_ID=CAMNT_0011971243 /DNA_START=30 /DNA_END=1889 /DNA_ORIENTATION=-